MLAIVLAAERRLLLSLLILSLWGYPLSKRALDVLLLVLVETSPNNPYLLVTKLKLRLGRDVITCRVNSDMHSSAAQPGNELVLLKHLAAPELPSETKKSVEYLS